MAKDKGTDKDKIPVFDIHTASFLELNNIPPELTLQGTRVVFNFEPSETLYRLLREYQNNPSIHILDYVNVLRRMRSRMLSMRS
jgi:hypothetical protein